MKLKVLCDNNTYIDMYYLGEPALSFYLEDEEEKILFDTGYSDVFLLNAGKMGIDLRNIDKIVLSHGHNDHTGGLKYLSDQSIHTHVVCHPEAFEYKEDDNGLYIGSPMNIEEASSLFILELTNQPLKISEHLTYLGQIEERLPFEKRYSIGKKVYQGIRRSDKILDDSALVYEGEDGLFIITGCSHSGICNIIEQARAVTGVNKVRGVIGGFHLMENNERLHETIQYFKENQIEELYPCHCVSLDAKVEMAKQLKIHEVGVGLDLEIN